MEWVCGIHHCNQETQISEEVDYFMDYYKTLHPAVFLSYEREAFYSKDKSDFRVTFDDTILCRQENLSLKSDVYGTPLLPEGMVLMEVKCSGGTYSLSSGDDGIHADTDLVISGSSTKLTVSKSYEGIEATNLIISGGEISVIASDDGLNAAGGNNSASTNKRPGQNSFSSSTGSIKISGGTVTIKMSGDGIDANGTIAITRGTITISGPNSGDTAILDFDKAGTISGGTFVGTGSSSMSQNFSSSSTQGVMMVNTGSQSAGTTIRLSDSNGNVLITHTAEQAFSCVIISHASLASGGTYSLMVGSSSTTITMNSTVYSSSSSGGMGGSHGGMGSRR